MQIICLGDSITDCGHLLDDFPLGNGYVQMLAEMFQKEIPGRRTDSYSDNSRSFLSNTAEFLVDNVVAAAEEQKNFYLYNMYQGGASEYERLKDMIH